jgi:aminobenzoyl-glutamate utilization protein B
MRHHTVLLCLLTVVAEPLGAGRAAVDDPAPVLARDIEGGQARYWSAAREIWTFAEVGYQEHKSSAVLQQLLAGAGFRVEPGVAGMPTAFVATFGSGKPVIGLIGEFDALPGLSQEAAPARKARVEGAAGHACGHHLFGVASAAAAIAVKNWLAAGKHAGTVRFYGTPAEEGGSGKVYMVREGLFKDVDVAVAWHPGDRNGASPSSSTANINAKFRFTGTPSHAAGAPERGRSALDGVEAMNHMVNMLREHVPQETRLHYVITRGGDAPNVVPGFAEVYYYVRHPDVRQVRQIFERVVNAANGAALGTDTKVEYEVMGGVYNVLPNDTLADAMHAHLRRVGGVTYDPSEQAFADAMRKELPPGGLALGTEKIVQPLVRNLVGSGSTDVGDVSWAVPTVQMTAATWVPGTPSHSWQAVASGGTTIGMKGMMVAARTLAQMTTQLLTDPKLVAAARAEFDKRREDTEYSALVGNRKPALDYRK